MLTDKKKLYQTMMSRLGGYDINSSQCRENAFRLIGLGIGGFIIFGGNSDEIGEFIRDLQKASEIPLFVASDVERGVGQQIKGATSFPCQMAMTAAIDRKNTTDVQLLKSAISAIATESLAMGINMPLIPVMDVNRNPNNPIICTRAFSDNPETVSWFGTAYVEILESHGLISCAKHFPGHGDTESDSHVTLPVISKDKTEIFDVDLKPFIAAIQSGVSAIMMGHLSVPALDSSITTISREIITNLLREKFSFNGLILTDALNMDALKNFNNVASSALNAGVDILLHPIDATKTAAELSVDIEAGLLAESTLDSAVKRILQAKTRLTTSGKLNIDYDAHKNVSATLTGKCLTIVKGTHEDIPPSDKAHLVIIGRNGESSIIKERFKSFAYLRNNVILPDTPTVIALFTSIKAWHGLSLLPGHETDLVREIIAKTRRTVVVSFGNPYVLANFMNATALIAAYEESDDVQRAFIKCLNGEVPCSGHLPVRLI